MDAARPEAWANPASVHAAGRASRQRLEGARDRVAGAIGASPAELTLTGGGTEACNLGVLGLASGPGEGPGHLVTTEIEHPAVARAVDRLAARGVRVTRLALPHGEPFTAEALREALTEDTRLVALQWVNHETGTCLPVAEYARVCRERGVALFVDATQALGKLPVDVGRLDADAVAFASHKLGGPAGAGALWTRRSLRALLPVLAGGGQERGRRPGTPDVLAQVGFGAACEHIAERLSAQARLRGLQTRMQAELAHLGGLINGLSDQRVATVVNASFPGRRGDQLVAAMDIEGVACASGAACSSGLAEPSPVIGAMYPDDPRRAPAALRFSFGPETTDDDIARAVAALSRVLAR